MDVMKMSKEKEWKTWFVISESFIPSYTKIYGNICTCSKQRNYNTYTSTNNAKMDMRDRVLIVIITNGNSSCRLVLMCFFRSHIYIFKQELDRAVFIFYINKDIFFKRETASHVYFSTRKLQAGYSFWWAFISKTENDAMGLWAARLNFARTKKSKRSVWLMEVKWRLTTFVSP